MKGSVIGEVPGAHALLGPDLEPGKAGWVDALIAALPALTGERRGFYEPVAIVPPPPPSGESAIIATYTRFAATSFTCQSAFAFCARLDALQWMTGVREAPPFAGAMKAQTGATSPWHGRAAAVAALPWKGVLTAGRDLAASYLRYQQILPAVVRGIANPAVAGGLRDAAEAAHGAVASALDALARLADGPPTSELDAVAAEVIGRLRGVRVAAPAGGTIAVQTVAAVEAAVIGWRDTATAFATALAASRADMLAAGAAADAAADSGERSRLVALAVQTTGEALAAVTAAAALARDAAGDDAALVAAIGPLVGLATRIISRYAADQAPGTTTPPAAEG